MLSGNHLLERRVHDSVKLETIGNICVNLCKFCESDFGVIIWEESVANV